MSAQLSVQATSPSEAVFREVAKSEDVDPIDLEPLAETIDPDALDALFEHDRDEDDLEVTFVYQGYDVTIAGDGMVDVAEQQGTRPASD